MKPKSHFRLSVLAVSLFAAGCMLPPYHSTSGFSSTYHRHLFRDNLTLIRIDSTHTRMPTEKDISAGEMMSKPDMQESRGIFFPMTLEFDTGPIKEDDENKVK